MKTLSDKIQRKKILEGDLLVTNRFIYLGDFKEFIRLIKDRLFNTDIRPTDNQMFDMIDELAGEKLI